MKKGRWTGCLLEEFSDGTSFDVAKEYDYVHNKRTQRAVCVQHADLGLKEARLILYLENNQACIRHRTCTCTCNKGVATVANDPVQLLRLHLELAGLKWGEIDSIRP